MTKPAPGAGEHLTSQVMRGAVYSIVTLVPLGQGQSGLLDVVAHCSHQATGLTTLHA